MFPGEEGKALLEKIKEIKNNTIKRSKSATKIPMPMRTDIQGSINKEENNMFREDILLGNNSAAGVEYNFENQVEEGLNQKEEIRKVNLKTLESKVKSKQESIFYK